MASPTSKHSSRSHGALGFSILELSIAVSILAFVSVLGLEGAAAYTTRRAYTITQEKIAVVDTAIKQYFKTNGSLPCPSDLTAAMTASASGTASVCGGASGVTNGGVPFITLGLPVSTAVDGYGTKLRYIVSRELTTAGTAANQFHNTGSIARIEVRTGKLEQTCSANCEVTFDPSAASPTGAAYVILSHGPDQRGAYGKSGAVQKACVPSVGPPNIYDQRIDTQNCGGATTPTITAGGSANAVFYDSRFNAGDVEANYFDDVILVRGKGDL